MSTVEAPSPLAEALSELTADGDRVEYRDGTLTLAIVPDQYWEAEEWEEVYGFKYSQRTQGCSRRPEEFDGASYKLTPYLNRANSNHGDYWHQPTKGQTPEQVRSQRQAIIDLLEYGPIGVVLTWQPDEECPHCGRQYPPQEASLYGVEPLPSPEYLGDVVQGLAEDLQLPE